VTAQSEQTNKAKSERGGDFTEHRYPGERVNMAVGQGVTQRAPRRQQVHHRHTDRHAKSDCDGNRWTQAMPNQYQRNRDQSDKSGDGARPEHLWCQDVDAATEVVPRVEQPAREQ